VLGKAGFYTGRQATLKGDKQRRVWLRQGNWPATNLKKNFKTNRELLASVPGKKKKADGRNSESEKKSYIPRLPSLGKERSKTVQSKHKSEMQGRRPRRQKERGMRGLAREKTALSASRNARQRSQAKKAKQMKKKVRRVKGSGDFSRRH